MIHSRIRRALVALALTLSLVVPGTAMAATSLSTAETLTVNSTLSITGLPASSSYGAGLAGANRAATAFNVAFSTDNPAGLKFMWQSSNLSRVGGGGTIPALNNKFLRFPTAAIGTGTCTLPGGLSTWSTAPGAAAAGTADFTVCTTSVATDLTFNGAVLSVTIPSGTAPGDYTGTTVLKVTDN